MNTFLSAAQIDLQMQYRLFASSVVAPKVEQLLAHTIDLQQLFVEFARHGYLSFGTRQNSGATLLDAILLTQEIGRHDSGLALMLGQHIACMQSIERAGDEKTKKEILPSLCDGSAVGTLAFSEAEAGTDLSAVQTNVSGGKINGTKTAVVSGDLADVFLVLAKESDKLALVAARKTKQSGIKAVSHHKLMGLQSAHVSDVEFSNAPVADGCVLAREQQALNAVEWALSTAKLILSSAALGMLDAATETSVAHANSRHQFGAPIGTFQGVQWKLADMAVETAAARLQLYRAAWSHDHDRDKFLCHAAMANSLSARVARLHCGEAIQILGARGILEEQPLSRFYDDAKVMEIAGGTAEFQKMLIARELHI